MYIPKSLAEELLRIGINPDNISFRYLGVREEVRKSKARYNVSNRSDLGFQYGVLFLMKYVSDEPAFLFKEYKVVLDRVRRILQINPKQHYQELDSFDLFKKGENKKVEAMAVIACTTIVGQYLKLALVMGEWPPLSEQGREAFDRFIEFLGIRYK